MSSPLAPGPRLFGPNALRFGLTPDPFCLRPRRRPFGLNQIPFGLSQNPCGLSQKPSGLSQIPFGLSQIPFGLSQIPFGLSQIPFGLSEIPFGLSEIPFGLSLSKPCDPVDQHRSSSTTAQRASATLPGICKLRTTARFTCIGPAGRKADEPGLL